MATVPKAVTADEWKWKVQSATDDILRAEEHRQDKKLMAAVNKEIEKRAKALTAARRNVAGKKVMQS